MNKHRIRALGLSCLAALSLIALTAIAAQAANLGNGGTAGSFKVENLTTLFPVPLNGQIEALTGNSNVHIVLLVPGLMSLRILCPSVDVEEAASKLINTNEGLLKVKFLGCLAMFPVGEKEEEVKGCKIPAGTIVATALILPKLHQSDGGVVELYLLFEGDPVKSTIATVEFESGKGCVLPLKAALTGSVVALVKEGNVEQATKLITFSEPIQRLFQERDANDNFMAGDQLLFGANEAFVDGNATLSLGGTHTNITWSVH